MNNARFFISIVLIRNSLGIVKIYVTFKKHSHADIFSTCAKYKFWEIVYSPGQSKMHTTQRHIFATLSNI